MKKTSIFISHASEDKLNVAKPLARELAERGFATWLDEFELKIGDSLRSKIDDGIRQCDFGVVVLSKHFFSKAWPQAELDALFTKEVVVGKKVLLPVFHDLELHDVAKHSAFLAARLGISTYKGIKSVADAIQDATLVTESEASQDYSVTHHDVYREFVRAAISRELRVPIDSITPRTGRGSTPPGAGSVFAGIDLIHVGGNELAEVITFINCDFHPTATRLTDETEVMRLSYLRNEAKASKAMLVSNVGFSAAANKLAQRENIALLKLSPSAEMESRLLAFADRSPSETLIADIERFIDSQQVSTYDKVVVHRLHGEVADGELIEELLRNPEIKAKAQEVLRDPNARCVAEKFLNENPELQRLARDFFKKF
jgi:hypothetical protein